MKPAPAAKPARTPQREASVAMQCQEKATLEADNKRFEATRRLESAKIGQAEAARVIAIQTVPKAGSPQSLHTTAARSSQCRLRGGTSKTNAKDDCFFSQRAHLAEPRLACWLSFDHLSAVEDRSICPIELPVVRFRRFTLGLC
jgi:hypothetical protein